MSKLAYEHGALFAVKEAARVGSAVPTGYRFDVNPEWETGLDDPHRAMAREAASKLNAWLQQNQGLGPGYAQHPEFARQVALMGRIGKTPAQKLGMSMEIPLAKPPTLTPPKVTPAKTPGTSKFTSKMKVAFEGNDKFPGGEADHKRLQEFDHKELARGAATESKEHGLPKSTAREIASDHLAEDPNFYKKEDKKASTFVRTHMRGN